MEGSTIVILFKTKEIPASWDHPSNNVKGFRWTVDVSPTCIGLFHQFRTQTGWNEGGGYYAVCCTSHWELGRKHLYYDGPHDSFSLGFLHFTWQGDWCDKCAEEA